ncbi:MAG: hypothetical protein J6T46_02355 [Victivallales bacterium]|nr:hypothetical protein [Victivallales bacterium]
MKTTPLLFCAAFCLLPVIAKAQQATVWTVACVNCGQFHYGDKKTAPDDYRRRWQKLFADVDADVFFMEDNSSDFPFNTIRFPKFDICADAKATPISATIVKLTNEIDGHKSPRYRAFRLVYNISGKKVAFYGMHLVAEGHIHVKMAEGEKYSLSQKLRQTQFQELINDAKQFDGVVFTGDFNAQIPEEYDIFKQNGFTLTNCSETYGTTATLRNIPADNIIVSPCIKVLEFKVLKDYGLDTDHFPLTAKLQF